MRILIVTRSTPLHPATGGMESASWDLARSLAASAEVVVLTTAIPDRAQSFVEGELRVETIPGTQHFHYGARWWIGTARASVKKYDAIISISAGATALVWWRRRESVYVFQAHGTALAELRSVWAAKPARWPLRSARLAMWATIDFFTYRRVDAVVSIGPAVTAGLHAWPYSSGWRKRPVVEIPNGVRPLPEVAPRANVRPVIVSIGRLVPQKGVDRVIAAISSLDADLIVLGDGPERKALESQALELGVSDRVQFRGSVSSDEVRSVLVEANVLVFVPRNIEREGLPMVVLEALAGQVRVVTLDADLWPSDVRNQLQFVSDADPASIANAVRSSEVGGLPELPARFTLANTQKEWLTLLSKLRRTKRS